MIYDKPVRELIRHMVAELAPQRGDVLTKDAAIDWFARRYPKIQRGTVSAPRARTQTRA